MRRVLVTGTAGFVGRHAVKQLVAKGCKVFGFDRQRPPFKASHLTNQTGDLLDREAIESAVSLSRPDMVYHFAGVTKSRDPVDYYRANVIGTVNLLEAIQEKGFRPSVLIASSSAVYGQTGRKKTSENCEMHPVTHYGASKTAQETAARQFFLSTGLPVLFARSFNLIGPGQPLGFACSDFAHQIALAETNPKDHTLRFGNLRAERDFVDVRDAVRAYTLIVESGRPGVAYNVCSQRPVSIGECLNMLLGMAKVPLTTTIDRGKLLTDDVQYQVGSSVRLHRHTGWKPRIPLRQSLEDLLDYWRLKVRSPE